MLPSSTISQTESNARRPPHENRQTSRSGCGSRRAPRRLARPGLDLVHRLRERALDVHAELVGQHQHGPQTVRQLVRESGVDVVVMRWPDGAKDAADFVEGRRLRGETDAVIARTVRDLCAAATAWNDVDVCDIPINEADAASSSSSSAPSPDADEPSGQDDLRRKIDELQKQLAELSAQVASS